VLIVQVLYNCFLAKWEDTLGHGPWIRASMARRNEMSCSTGVFLTYIPAN